MRSTEFCTRLTGRLSRKLSDKGRGEIDQVALFHRCYTFHQFLKYSIFILDMYNLSWNAPVMMLINCD